MTSVFISHNRDDKPFARRLSRDLQNQDVRTWLDEAELRIGDSLIEKLRQGIDEVEYLAVVLSPSSVASEWVKREVDVAMTQEIQGRRVRVLPLMYRQCEPPGFLMGKVYGNFTDDSAYEHEFEKLVQSIGVVFNPQALVPAAPEANLGSATDGAFRKAMRLRAAPFHRPYQYVGMTVAQAENATGQTSNSVGNIMLDDEYSHMLLEAEGNFISYVDIELKETAPQSQSEPFESEPVLGALSISPSELQLVRVATHCHTYEDHRKRLRVSVAFHIDGGALSAGFSSKYYGT